MLDVAIFALGGLTALIVCFVVIPLFRRLVRKLAEPADAVHSAPPAEGNRDQATGQ